MAVKSPFQYLTSVESETPTGIHGWAQRLVDLLRTPRIVTDLFDTSLIGQELKVVRVKDDASGYELADEELGLSGIDLTGKAGYFVKVKADETGFELVP